MDVDLFWFDPEDDHGNDPENDPGNDPDDDPDLKIFWAADAESNFPLVAETCLGRPLGQERQVNLGRNTAIKLATPFFKTGRNVTTDNFFTDKDLANTLMSNGLTFVGNEERATAP